MARRQKARQTREFRHVAERLAANERESDWSSPARPKGWRQSGKIKPDFRWGYVEAASVVGSRRGEQLVWIEKSSGELLGSWRSSEGEIDLETLFHIAIPSVLLIVILLTAVGLKFLVLFAKSRDDFLAAAAHDLTTPLVGMRMMIGRRDDEAKLLVERLIRIVANINDFLKLGGRNPKLLCERVDLVACYREAYGLFQADFQDAYGGKDVPLEVENAVAASGDATRVVQILWNLLGNDLKYAAPFGEVRVRIRRDGARMLVEVADSGPGLTSAQRRRAFDRYYRAKTSLVSGKGGFGIGLCSAREFARLMGGDLTVRANVPKGCVFTLTLPVFEERQ